MNEEKGLRFNEGKQRLELVPTSTIEGIASILTYGANKYTVKDDQGNIIVKGDNNWRNGLSWMSVLASMKRHIAKLENGEDFDDESGLMHIDHALTNLAFIKEYYKIHPELDDRQHKYLKPKKIGLDIDEVLCNWIGGWMEYYSIDTVPTSWAFDRQIFDRFNEMREVGELEDFYSELKPLISPLDIPFEPHCYITSRPCSLGTTIKWLDKNGFPTKPVHCIGVGKSKVDVAKEAGIDMFIDDSYDNFVALNKAGICCFLYDAPHNHRYDVGYKRIYGLKDFKQRFL